MVGKAADSRLFLFHKIGARLWRGEFIKRGFGKAGDQQAVRVAVDLPQPGFHRRITRAGKQRFAVQLIDIVHDIHAFRHIAAIVFLQAERAVIVDI